HELRGFGQLVGFLVVDHELEAADAVRDGDRDIRAARVGGDLDVRVAERVGGQVDDQPAGRGGGAVEAHAHLLAGGAAAAVAADQVAGAPGLRARDGGEVDLDVLAGVAAGGHGRAPAHLDAVEPVERVEQLGVDQRLHEAVALGPAERGVGGGDLGQQAAVGVDEAHDLVRGRVRQHAVDHADGLEGAQRFVVDADAARVVDQRRAFLHHQG